MQRWLQGAIAVGTLVVAVWSVHDSLANVAVGAARSDLGLSWSPLARVEVAYQRNVTNISAAPVIDQQTLLDAKQVLRVSPLNSHALWLLAMSRPERSDQRLEGLELAERVNRRDFGVEAQLAREYGLRGDSAASMARVDRILTVYGTSVPQFIARLAPGLSNPPFRVELLAYRSRPWFRQLLNIAIIDGVDAQSIADTLLAAKLNQREFPPDYLPLLLQKLLAAGSYDTAVRIAKQLGGEGLEPSVDIGFERDSVDQRFAPLHWSLSADPARLVHWAGNDQVEISLAAPNAGVALSRYTKIPSGRYTFSAKSTNGSSVEWVMSCAGNGRSEIIWRQSMSGTPNAAVVSELVIPANCAVQYWQVNTGPGDGTANQTLRIGPVSLGPA